MCGRLFGSFSEFMSVLLMLFTCVFRIFVVIRPVDFSVVFFEFLFVPLMLFSFSVLEVTWEVDLLAV